MGFRDVISMLYILWEVLYRLLYKLEHIYIHTTRIINLNHSSGTKAGMSACISVEINHIIPDVLYLLLRVMNTSIRVISK